MEDDGSSMPPPSQPPPAFNTTTTAARVGNKMSKDIGNNLNLEERGAGSGDGDSKEAGSQGTAKAASTASAQDVEMLEGDNQPKHKTAAGGEAKQRDMNKIIEEDLPSSDQEQDSSEIQPLEEAEDPFNEKASVVEASAGFEANFEANFDANFDDAFAGSEVQPQTADDATQEDEVDVGAPKQVVGGRASIPEELDSNQLERLQNLKESNA